MPYRSSSLTEPMAMPDLIDTHCHLDGEEFASDLDLVLKRAAQSGVTRWINVGYSLRRWQPTIDLTRVYRGMSCMLGIHPGHASEWNSETASELRRIVATGVPVAIGEIGLDFYRGETNVVEQVAAFTGQLSMAHEFGLPVSIHMRNAEQMVIDVLEAQPVLPVLLFHSFEGSDVLANWILQNDAYIGVGGLATRTKASTLRANITRVGLDRIVLETDSPYLVPSGFKHRHNTPESIPLILQTVADLFDIEQLAVAHRTTATASRIFESLDSV